MSRLTGQVAVVTGGSRGIGAAIARRLARDGARVIVVYNKQVEEAARVVLEIKSAGGEAVALQCDVGNPDDIGPMVAKAAQAFGRLDILVNNAAVGGTNGPLERITAEGYQRLFDINVRGAMLVTQAALAHMSPVGGGGGRVINISSGITRAKVAGSSVYSASKAALEMMTRVWSAELGPRGITVNAVLPGMIETDMLRRMIPPPVIAGYVKQTPLGRLGTPEDVADVVAFLASDEARWITGEAIGVSGGG